MKLSAWARQQGDFSKCGIFGGKSELESGVAPKQALRPRDARAKPSSASASRVACLLGHSSAVPLGALYAANLHLEKCALCRPSGGVRSGARTKGAPGTLQFGEHTQFNQNEHREQASHNQQECC
jgi:hypothetical protein